MQRRVRSCAMLVVAVVVAAAAVSCRADGSTAAPLSQSATPMSTASIQDILSQLGSGWQFQKVILALQPMLHYSGKATSGFYQYWDTTEVNPPTALDIDRNWNLDDTPANIRARMFNREAFFLSYLNQAGATYYRTFRLPAVRPDGGDVLVHQFWYYFPTGEGRYIGSADQGFALVEIEQAIPRSDAEMGAYRDLVTADLQKHRTSVQSMLDAETDPDRRAQLGALAENLDGILARPVEVPINYYVEAVYTTSVMYPGDTKPLRVLTYRRDGIKWLKTRPSIYVAQGTHDMVGDRADFLDGDRCDAPYLVHPQMREKLVNLHNPYDADNPFPRGTNPHGLKFHGTFVEHPIYWLGARRYLEKRAAGAKLGPVEVRWHDDTKQAPQR